VRGNGGIEGMGASGAEAEEEEEEERRGIRKRCARAIA
jgi:hypothetical protein